MDRQQKEQFVQTLGEVFSNAGIVIVSQNKGKTVAQANKLRRSMRESGASYLVTKNRLAKIAIKGTKYESLSSLFVGPTAIAYSNDDPAAIAKVIADFAKDTEAIEIVGASLGEQNIGAEGVKQLASLPSLDVLRSQLVGIIGTPAGKIARALKEPSGSLARILEQKGR